MTGGQRQMIGALVLSLLVALGIASLRSHEGDGERIAAAGVVARAGPTTVVEAIAEVADPATPASTTLAALAPTTITQRQNVPTKAPVNTTTAPPATVAPSTTAPAPVAAASVATTITTARPATTTTAVPPAITTVDPCRNSTDSACGAFRFDPQPGGDRPMTVGVSVQPATPVAGQPMVFHMSLTDPDGVSYDGTNFNFGNSGIGGSTPEPCAKFGRWDPPAPDPGSASKTLDVTHTYFEAGSYTATFVFDAGPFDCADSVTGRGDRPYASSATASVTVQVAP